MVMPTPAATGRGAWSAQGNRVGSAYYKRGCSTTAAPLDQSQWAVQRGSAAIQQALGDLIIDGAFGEKTEAAVRAFQSRNGLYADGVVGPKTARALFVPRIVSTSNAFGVDTKIVFGIVFQESGFDPGAVGYTTPNDLGLAQINTKVHSYPDSVTDPAYAITWTAERIKAFAAKYASSAVNAGVLYDALILQHHAPSWAGYLVKNGSYPTAEAKEKGELYVSRVKSKIALY